MIKTQTIIKIITNKTIIMMDGTINQTIKITNKINFIKINNKIINKNNKKT